MQLPVQQKKKNKALVEELTTDNICQHVFVRFKPHIQRNKHKHTRYQATAKNAKKAPKVSRCDEYLPYKNTERKKKMI